MPLRNDSDYGHNMWYHFDFGPIRFVAIDSETNYHESPYPPVFKGDHVNYVKQAIRSADRTATPLLVALAHRPIYGSGKEYCDPEGRPTGPARKMKELFEEDFLKYKVDLMVTGHVHAYGK